MNHNSAWGHSANFVMPLDGDGSDRFKVHDFIEPKLAVLFRPFRVSSWHGHHSITIRSFVIAPLRKPTQRETAIPR